MEDFSARARRRGPLLSTHVTHLGQKNIPGRVHQSNGVEVKAARARLSHTIPSPKVNLCRPQPVDILVERIVEGEPLSQQVHHTADQYLKLRLESTSVTQPRR